MRRRFDLWGTKWEKGRGLAGPGRHSRVSIENTAFEQRLRRATVSASTQLGWWLQAEGITKAKTWRQTFAWIFCAVFPHLRTDLEPFSPQPRHSLSEVLAFSWLSDQLKLPGVEGHLGLTLLWPLRTENLATTFIFAPHCT